MAENNSAKGTAKNTTELKAWYDENKKNIENFVKAQDSVHILRDITKTGTRSIPSIDKESLKSWIKSPGRNEKNLRDTARYLYYRSNIFYRLCNWYADMWALDARKITPPYDLVKGGDAKKMLKSYNDTLKQLDLFNIQNNMVEVFLTCYIEDVYYGIRYTDDIGTFFYRLEPDECVIDGRYSTGDYSFAVDMSKWKSAQRQKIIENLGEPLASMYKEYERTNEKLIHMPDEYAACFKFRTDLWDVAIPPLLPILLQLASLEEILDVQAEADKLSIYKLIYMPLETINGTKDVDDFTVDPKTAYQYFQRLVQDAIPDNVGSAIVPVPELKTIDFSKTADSEVNSAEKTQNQILATAGGGAVINSNNITSTAAFQAWLEAETQFALSSLIGQVTGAVNRWLSYYITNPAKVEFFEVSCYTRKQLAEQLLDSCKYSFSNRLAYNTLIGISEKETLAMEFFETQVLNLPGLMNHPLTSSFTQSGASGEVGEGAPTKDATELTDSGERNRNR